MGGSCRRQITGESKGQALHGAVHFCRTPNIVLSKAATAFQPSDISSRPISCPGREILLIADSWELTAGTEAAPNHADLFCRTRLGLVPGAAGNRRDGDAGLRGTGSRPAPRPNILRSWRGGPPFSSFF